jgi:Cd2+/Zn2+-exporting ATPase
MSSNTAQSICTLRVGGMDCPSCENTVRSAVEKMPGVVSVEANHMSMILKVEGDGENFDSDKILKEIRTLGYQPQKHEKHRSVILRIPALVTPEEEHQLRKVLTHNGTRVLDIDLKSHTVTISHQREDKEIIAALKKAGFKASIYQADDSGQMFWNRIKSASTAIGFITLAAGTWAQFSGQSPAVFVSLFVATIILSGIPILQKGIMGLLRFNFDMNGLMTISVIGAMCIGEWFEAATVIFLGAIAVLLEAWSMDRARSAVAKLMDLAPASAILIRDGKEIELPLDEISLGDSLLIKPGGKIALDGEVLEGVSDIDQSPITGESIPVTRQAGDPVFAGSINTNGTLTIKVTAIAEESTVARIVHMVQEAQAHRSPTERFIDRFAAIYTPAAIIFAAAVATIPPLFWGDWSTWFYRALVILIIACPCALVISTPVGIVSGLAAAARDGILIKGGNYLEMAAKIDVVAFDKTGTLTEGKLQVAEIQTVDDFSESELIIFAASLEQHAEHPIAAALVKLAREKSLALSKPSQSRAHPGMGVEGFVESEFIQAGNLKLMEIMGTSIPAVCQEMAKTPGTTQVYISRNKKLVGCFLLTDQLRHDSIEAIASLAELEIEPLIISGDKSSMVEKISSQLGIANWHAELMPGQKLQTLQQIQLEEKKVMMVGDGINDAPALALADVGVVMGEIGTDVARETADVVLMQDSVSSVPKLIKHSKKTIAIIRQNIAFSIGIKLLFVALSMVGLSTLWMAVLADTGLSMLVTANSLRLLRKK